MKQPIQFPKISGKIPRRQAHCNIPEGLYEREIGKEGFFGNATHMLHKHPPTSWVNIEGTLAPRCFNLNNIGKAIENPAYLESLYYNQDAALRFWQTDKAMHELFRNAMGDDLLFIHQGEGAFFCDYGHMLYEKGDYILIPRNTMWRITPHQNTAMLLIEATNQSYFLPDKGILGPHAIFDPSLLVTPEINDIFLEQQDEAEWRIMIKHHQQTTKTTIITYPYNPLDALSWQGNLSVVKINCRDIRPVMSHRYHIPPSVHTTFLSQKFVVCTFCPRPIESDPAALKVPFFHNNDDYDELIFYHDGDFFSRDYIKPGMVTFHPSGLTHGPHPKALKAALEAPHKHTNETAVMVDFRNRLDINENILQACEDLAYVHSWHPSVKDQ